MNNIRNYGTTGNGSKVDLLASTPSQLNDGISAVYASFLYINRLTCYGYPEWEQHQMVNRIYDMHPLEADQAAAFVEATAKVQRKVVRA